MSQTITCLLRAGTNERVLYQNSLLEPPPDLSSGMAPSPWRHFPGQALASPRAATTQSQPQQPQVLHRVLTQVWYSAYESRSPSWEPGFFDVACPW